MTSVGNSSACAAIGHGAAAGNDVVATGIALRLAKLQEFRGDWSPRLLAGMKSSAHGPEAEKRFFLPAILYRRTGSEAHR
jgi:hypothetical protein